MEAPNAGEPLLIAALISPMKPSGGLRKCVAAADNPRTYKSHIDYNIYCSYTDPAMTTTIAPTTIPISEAAERLGVHENTVRNWIDQGLLDGYRTPTGRRKLRLTGVERLEREMFGVPTSVVEVTAFHDTPPQSDQRVEYAQGKLPLP